MSVKSILTILVGTALAGGASVFVMNNAGTLTGAAEAVEPDMLQVVVAKSEIAFGEAIEAQMLGTQEWPRTAVPPGVFIDMVALVGTDKPRRALGKIFPGDLMLAVKVSQPGENVTIVQKLTPGHRAMAISVDAAIAVGGFVSPGDRVDIVMTQGGGEEMRAVTILQNIRVIGIDQTSEEQQGKPVVARTITVEVTPDEGQRLALAQRAGRLSLTLRELEAPEQLNIPQLELSDLFEAEVLPVVEVATPEAPVPARPRVIVRRGTQSEEVILK